MNRNVPLSRTSAARLTPVAPAAIAVIALRGPQAESIIDRCWIPASRLPRRIDAIRLGRWQGTTSSEDVVLCWKGDEDVEIHCHGGKQAADRILSDMQYWGAEVADSIEPAYQASLAEEALEDLLKTNCLMPAAILLDQARGALTQAFDKIDQYLASDEHALALNHVEQLLTRADIGMHLSSPWRLAIVGPPNVGKSSLLNAIIGYDRAIVEASAGTTRDVLNEPISLMGWPFIVCDTAGIRVASEPIEREGVARALQQIHFADLLLLLVEAKPGWTSLHADLWNRFADKSLIVHTKADLDQPIPSTPAGFEIRVSAQTGQGLDELYHAIVEWLIPSPPHSGDAVPFRPEHLRRLLKLKTHLQRQLDGE